MKTDLLKSFLENPENIPHAFLLLGQESVGRELVKDFLNSDSIQFDASDSNLESLREILHLASLKAVSGAKKFVLLLNMDKANVQMQNALLKTLEEPSNDTVLVLVSATPLLPTIMSRCQVIFLPREQSTEISAEVLEGLELLEKHRAVGLAEKLALVNTLAELDDEVLPEVVEQWIYKLTSELKTTPQKYTLVRNALETYQALKGNFNKKMVLQNFVTTAL